MFVLSGLAGLHTLGHLRCHKSSWFYHQYLNCYVSTLLSCGACKGIQIGVLTCCNTRLCILVLYLGHKIHCTTLLIPNTHLCILVLYLGHEIHCTTLLIPNTRLCILVLYLGHEIHCTTLLIPFEKSENLHYIYSTYTHSCLILFAEDQGIQISFLRRK